MGIRYSIFENENKNKNKNENEKESLIHGDNCKNNKELKEKAQFEDNIIIGHDGKSMIVK